MSPEQIASKLPPPLDGPRIEADEATGIKDCPFCNNAPDPIPLGSDYGYGIECSTCHFRGPWGDTRGMAIKAWNVRGGK